MIIIIIIFCRLTYIDRRQDTHTHRKPDEEELKQDRRGVEATVSRYLGIIDTRYPNAPQIRLEGMLRGTVPPDSWRIVSCFGKLASRPWA